MVTNVDAEWVERHRHDDNVVIVNVLSAASFAKEHIPASLNVPVDEPDFERRFRAVAPDRDAPVVVYCASGSCQASPRAAQMLELDGYTNVHDFTGGIESWKDAGNRVARSGPPLDAPLGGG